MATLAMTVIGIGLAANASAADLSGNATLTTDYVWRGSTQTQGDPAVQAGFKVSGASGLYASAWGSNVKFAPETHASSELDFTISWGKRLNDEASSAHRASREAGSVPVNPDPARPAGTGGGTAGLRPPHARPKDAQAVARDRRAALGTRRRSDGSSPHRTATARRRSRPS